MADYDRRIQASRTVEAGVGADIVHNYVGGVKIFRTFSSGLRDDPQLRELNLDIAVKLGQIMVPNKKVESALNRYANLVRQGPKQSPDAVRNQLAKIAGELGLKMPKGF